MRRILGPGPDPFFGSWDLGYEAFFELGPGTGPLFELGPGTGDVHIVKAYLVIFYNGKFITISRVHAQGRTASTGIPGGHTRHIPMTHDQKNWRIQQYSSTGTP